MNRLVAKSKKLNFKKRLNVFLRNTGKIPLFVRAMTANKVQSIRNKRAWRRTKIRC